MTSRPTDKPMARAQAHLAAGRYAEAVGAFRAVLGIDSSVIPARLGLADAMAARGQRSAAVDGLVEAAESCVERKQHDRALVLYGKALALDPARMELNLDVAVVEHAMGCRPAAIARVEELAERYMIMGRTDEAADILRFASSWDEDDATETTLEEIEELEADDVCTVVTRNPLSRERPPAPAPQVHTETVVCATVLIRPDGSLWLGPSPAAGAPARDEADPDMVTRVKSSPMPARSGARSTQAPVPPRPETGARPAHDTIPRRPRSLPVGAAARPANGPRAAQASALPASHRRIEPAPVPAAPAREPKVRIERAPRPASPALVDRLRQRAGLAPEAASGSVGASPAIPRAAQSTKAGTEPIAIRRPALGRSEREDDVTHRFRPPAAPRRAAAG